MLNSLEPLFRVSIGLPYVGQACFSLINLSLLLRAGFFELFNLSDKFFTLSRQLARALLALEGERKRLARHHG